MCIIPQPGSFYETREGYRAYVAAKSPFPASAKEDKAVFIGWSEDFDGVVSAVEWHSNGHFNADNKPHEYDLESEPIPTPEAFKVAA